MLGRDNGGWFTANNNLSCSSDTVLLTPPAAALQCLINGCQMLAAKQIIIYIKIKKNVYFIFLKRNLKFDTFHVLNLTAAFVYYPCKDVILK